jgi:hypothetical protein
MFASRKATVRKNRADNPFFVRPADRDGRVGGDCSDDVFERHGGTVIDPATGLKGRHDVAIAVRVAHDEIAVDAEAIRRDPPQGARKVWDFTS